MNYTIYRPYAFTVLVFVMLFFLSLCVYGQNSGDVLIAASLKDSQQAYQNKNWDSVIKIMQPTYDKLSQGMGGEGNPADVKEWVAFKDRLSDAYVRRGEATFGKGNLDGALADFQVSVKVNPNNWIGYNDIATVNVLQGEQQRAIDNYVIAINIGHHIESYTGLARAYFENGQYKKSLDAANRAIEINPRFVEAIVDQAGAYYMLNEKDQAILSYKKALSIDPNNEIAKDNLKKLLEQNKS